MNQFLEALYALPDYITAVVSGPHLPYAIVGGLVFLIVLLFTNKFTYVLRQAFVLIAVGLGVYAYVSRRYTLAWLCILVLAVLLIFRFLRFSFVTIRQNIINSRIEKRALANAEMRRGAARFATAQTDDQKAPETDGQTSADTSENSDSESGESNAAPAPEGLNPRSSAPEGRDYNLTRSEVNDAIEKMEYLRDIHVLTEEEFNEKKSALYSRLG